MVKRLKKTFGEPDRFPALVVGTRKRTKAFVKITDLFWLNRQLKYITEK